MAAHPGHLPEQHTWLLSSHLLLVKHSSSPTTHCQIVMSPLWYSYSRPNQFLFTLLVPFVIQLLLLKCFFFSVPEFLCLRSTSSFISLFHKTLPGPCHLLPTCPLPWQPCQQPHQPIRLVILTNLLLCSVCFWGHQNQTLISRGQILWYALFKFHFYGVERG